MTEERKQLYRELLYWAMVDMRAHSSGPGHISYLGNWRGRSRASILTFTGEMNNWLHNTARYSAINFEGFDEACFWRDYQYFRRQFPATQWAALTEEIIKKLQL